MRCHGLEEMTLYRVQHVNDGRGPWRPGFSESWTDHSRTDEEYRKLKRWTQEFGLKEILTKVKQGEHAGCGCVNPDQLKLWFTPLELSRLIALGYHAVTFDDAKVIAVSDIQCVFTRKQPLHLNVEPFSLYA